MTDEELLSDWWDRRSIELRMEEKLGPTPLYLFPRDEAEPWKAAPLSEGLRAAHKDRYAGCALLDAGQSAVVDAIYNNFWTPPSILAEPWELWDDATENYGLVVPEWRQEYLRGLRDYELTSLLRGIVIEKALDADLSEPEWDRLNDYLNEHFPVTRRAA